LENGGGGVPMDELEVPLIADNDEGDGMTIINMRIMWRRITILILI